MSQAIARVKARFESLLSANAGAVRIGIGFDYNLGACGVGPNGLTIPIIIDDPQISNYPGVRSTLNNVANGDGEPFSEIVVCESLPPGQTVPFARAGGVIAQASFAGVPRPIVQRWGVPIPPGADGATAINALCDFDFDPLDGIEVGKRDFEGTLTHELLHTLGFQSTLGAPWTGVVPLWDLFRLGASTLASGDRATADELQTLPREFRAGQEAIGVMLLNSPSGAGRLSTGTTGGDGYSADHWKYSALNGGVVVGIMDPRGDAGVRGRVSSRDLRALDIIGWNMESPNRIYPDDPMNLQPSRDTRIASRTPTVHWEGGAGADSFAVFVFRGNVINNSQRVFQMRDISTSQTEVPIPSGVLDWGQGYTYLVAADGFWGPSHGGPISFDVKCPADVDDGNGGGNPDGGVTVDDLLYYLGIFTLGSVQADLDDGSGTGTPDGGVTIDDLLFFIIRFSGGC